MLSDNHKISLRQMQALFCFYFLGTASLFLPAELAEGSGRACWLVMLIGGLLAAFFSLVLTYLGKKEPTWTVVEWLRNTFGGVLGSVLAVLIAGKIAVDAMLEVRIFTEILRSTMLPHTPLWLMVGTLLALSAFGVARGIEGQARGAEILFFFVFPPFVLLLFAVALTAGEAYFIPVQLPKLDGLRRGLCAALVSGNDIPAVSAAFSGKTGKRAEKPFCCLPADHFSYDGGNISLLNGLWGGIPVP